MSTILRLGMLLAWSVLVIWMTDHGLANHSPDNDMNKCRDWITVTHGVCNTNTASFSYSGTQSNGPGTFYNSTSYVRNGAGTQSLGPDCYWLTGKGFNDRDGWHLAQVFRSPPSPSCINSYVFPAWDVTVIHYPGIKMGPYVGGAYYCQGVFADCYGTVQFRFTDEEAPPSGPPNITGYTSSPGGRATAACFNTPGC